MNRSRMPINLQCALSDPGSMVCAVNTNSDKTADSAQTRMPCPTKDTLSNDQLVPVLRHVSHFTRPKGCHLAAFAARVARHPISPDPKLDLQVALVNDVAGNSVGMSTHVTTEEVVVKFGSLDAGYEAAFKNLASKTPGRLIVGPAEVPGQPAKAGLSLFSPGTFQLQNTLASSSRCTPGGNILLASCFGDGYDSVRLLMPGVVNNLCRVLRCKWNELVVWPVTQEKFYAASCADPVAMCALGQQTLAKRSLSSRGMHRSSSWAGADGCFASGKGALPRNASFAPGRNVSLSSNGSNNGPAADLLASMPLVLASRPGQESEESRLCSYVPYPNVGELDEYASQAGIDECGLCSIVFNNDGRLLHPVPTTEEEAEELLDHIGLWQHSGRPLPILEVAQQCGLCGSVQGLKMCGGCAGSANPSYYCSVECQRAHWPAHKAACHISLQRQGSAGSATVPISVSDKESDTPSPGCGSPTASATVVLSMPTADSSAVAAKMASLAV